MKKVLVTGASGSIGVSLRELLKGRYTLRLQERPGYASEDAVEPSTARVEA